MIRPDKWVMVEWTKNGDSFRKILSGFMANGTWELSHIIDNYEDMDDYYEVYTRRGTVYKLVKLNQGFTPLTAKVYKEMEQKATTDPDVMIGVLSI